jgi:hypothetical protein
MGPTALLPLRRKACWGFFRPKNPTALAGCEPTNLGTKGHLIIKLNNFSVVEHNRYMYCINFHLPDTCSVVFLLLFYNIHPTRYNFTQFIYIWKLLYMFWMLLSPIIRSECNCIYSIWYLSHRYCCLPLSGKSWNSSTKQQIAVTVWQIPDAVDTVVFAPDDGWRYHLKHVEQFSDINKLSKLHLVGYILEYICNARTHET